MAPCAGRLSLVVRPGALAAHRCLVDPPASRPIFGLPGLVLTRGQGDVVENYRSLPVPKLHGGPSGQLYPGSLCYETLEYFSFRARRVQGCPQCPRPPDEAASQASCTRSRRAGNRRPSRPARATGRAGGCVSRAGAWGRTVRLSLTAASRVVQAACPPATCRPRRPLVVSSGSSRTGDVGAIDIPARSSSLEVPESVLAERLRRWGTTGWQPAKRQRPVSPALRA